MKLFSIFSKKKKPNPTNIYFDWKNGYIYMWSPAGKCFEFKGKRARKRDGKILGVKK